MSCNKDELFGYEEMLEFLKIQSLKGRLLVQSIEYIWLNSLIWTLFSEAVCTLFT